MRQNGACWGLAAATPFLCFLKGGLYEDSYAPWN